MPHYELFHPDTELIGQIILDFEKTLDDPELRAYFHKHDLVDIDPDTWYPAQRWVNVINDIANSQGAMLNFVNIGIRQIALAIMPPEFDDMPLVAIFESLEDAYRMNYRGTDIGSVTTKEINANHIQITVRSFEPDDLWYGNIYGIVRRYAETESNFTVEYANNNPQQEEHSEVTVFNVIRD